MISPGDQLGRQGGGQSEGVTGQLGSQPKISAWEVSPEGLPGGSPKLIWE